MARARLISRSLGGSRRFHALVATAGALAEFAQVLYPLIVVNADDFGRLAADGESVKFQVFPSSPRTFLEFDAALGYLDAVGLIALYEVDHVKYLQVNHFDDHQQGLHKRTTSTLPNFSGKFREIPASRARAELNRTEGKGTEGKGTEGKRKEKSGEAAALSQVSTNEDGPIARARKSSPARAGRPVISENPDQNLRVITKIAHEAIAQIGAAHPDIVDTVKSMCATQRINYNSRTVVKAIESAVVQRHAGSRR